MHIWKSLQATETRFHNNCHCCKTATSQQSSRSVIVIPCLVRYVSFMVVTALVGHAMIVAFWLCPNKLKWIGLALVFDRLDLLRAALAWFNWVGESAFAWDQLIPLSAWNGISIHVCQIFLTVVCGLTVRSSRQDKIGRQQHEFLMLWLVKGSQQWHPFLTLRAQLT